MKKVKTKAVSPGEPERIANVFEWLDQVRQRPTMFIRDQDALEDLSSILWGYETAIRNHQIDESTPRFDRTFNASVPLFTRRTQR